MKGHTLKGKTVKSIDSRSINSWTITFKDGTKYRLFAESALYTECGNISGLFLRKLKRKVKRKVKR